MNYQDSPIITNKPALKLVRKSMPVHRRWFMPNDLCSYRGLATKYKH